MNDTMEQMPPLWILAAPTRTPDERDALLERLTTLCDASPVELETPGQDVVWLEAYFEEEAQARLVRQVLQREFSGEFPGIEFSVRACPSQDWTTFWRHHFHVRNIGNRLRIVPEWLRDEVTADLEQKDPVQEDAVREVVLVNPGLSFGTGDHFTTRYCLEMLDRLAAEGVTPDRMLDAGCGSAIIAIAARKLGWPSILAVDFDPVALKQAAENLELNDISSGVELAVMDLTREWPREKFPVVFANLYGGLLMELAPRLLNVCAGTLILSGIRAVEAEAVSTIFAQLGAVERGSNADHEWCGLWLEVPHHS